MSTNEEDGHNGTSKGRVIPINAEDEEPHEEEDSPTLPPNPEMERALREAITSVEKRESGKAQPAEEDMARKERENFQGRIRDLHIQLMEKTKEIEKLNDRTLRAQADLDNFKKRAQKERADQFNYGHEEITKDFLEVLDNLERALEHAQSNPSSLIEGVKLTQKNMEHILERYHVTPIKALGEKFDPRYHQAVSQVYKDDVEPGIVVEEHQRGFILKDRLLRPSMVVVSAKSTDTGETQNTTGAMGE